MDHHGKTQESLQKKKNAVQAQDNNAADPPELDKKRIEIVNPEAELNLERVKVIEEIAELFGNEDIVIAVNKFKADSEEKKIAIEFANAHIQFLNQIIESDYKKSIERNDVEIRDLVSNVNAMLQKKDEYLFTTIITHSPSHYKNIQRRFSAQIKKEGKK